MTASRILVAAYDYRPGGVSEGWTTHQMVMALRALGRRVVVLCRRHPAMPPGYGVVRTACVAPYRYGMFGVNYAEFSARCVAAARRLRNELAVVQHISPISLRVPNALGSLGRPFIWGPVGGSMPYPNGFDEYSEPYAPVNLLRRLDKPRMHLDPTLIYTMRKAARIVVTTSMSAEQVPDRYRDKVVVIPEGADAGWLLPAPLEEQPYIFSSGRLVRYKAMDLLVRAFAKLRTAGSVKLIITGEGPLQPELTSLIERLGVRDLVQLPGRVPRERNLELMRHSLFCVFPALKEGFGHVNLEAMAAWKPVVVTDWAGPRDTVVNGETGFKVLGRNPDEHVEQMAAAMQRLLDSSQLRQSMGHAGQQRIRTHYAWPVLAARYDELYRELSA